MESQAISLPCLPPYAVSRQAPLLLDETFDDFDAQAERLIDHDQRYLQLTPGAFRGRFLSGFFGPDVALHVELGNQSLLQEIVGADECFTFGITLSSGPDFATNGQGFAATDVLVLPPRGSLLMCSPVGGGVAAFAITRTALLAHPAVTPALADWLAALDGANACLLRAPDLAARLRRDCRDALDLATATRPDDGTAARIGQALLASLAAGLSLGWRGEAATSPLPRRLLQFQAWRAASAESDLSPRQVEKALAAVTGLGPMSYLRLERLHEARRALQSAPPQHSIGDIAASFGFWDWSRFTAAYRQHFGERPSDTRRRTASPASRS